MSAPALRRGAVGGALAFVLLALAASVGPLAVVGLPGSFASSGMDVGAAMLWLHGFSGALARGTWWPRWLADGNRGFGSPAFFFYPPGAYWAASGVRAAAGLDVAGALVASAVLFRAAAAALAYAWLRRLATPRAALAAAALFALHTYNMLVNPLVRFAFAEMAGTCLLLIALIAVDSRRPILWVPAAFAALALTHLPTALLAGGVLPAWAAAWAGGGRGGFVRGAAVLAACLLGTGVAAAYLVPALLLLPEIHTEGWETGGLTVWTGHFLLDGLGPPKPPVQFLLMNAGFVVMAVSAVALGAIGRTRAPPMADRKFAGTAILLAALCLLMTPLSRPVWAALPLLQQVQFPSRLMPLATAVWAALVARRLDALSVEPAARRAGGRAVAATGALLAAAVLWIPFSAATAGHPAFARYSWTRLQFAPPSPRPLPLVNPVEYTPRATAAAGWLANDPASDALLRWRLAESRAASPGLAVALDPAGALTVRGEAGRPAAVVLPQLAFPGWVLSGTPPGAALATDSATGLLRLDLPPGLVDVAVSREATPEEALGWRVSAAAAALWLSVLLLRGRPRVRAQ